MIDKYTKQIICTDFSKCRNHDFKLFKNSGIRISDTIQEITDTVYQGIKKIHQASYLPKKKSKKNPLSDSDKATNKYISSMRTVVENIICKLKLFKILSEIEENVLLSDLTLFLVFITMNYFDKSFIIFSYARSLIY